MLEVRVRNSGLSKDAGRFATPMLLDLLLNATYQISYNEVLLVFDNHVSFQETALPVHYQIFHMIAIAKQKQL